MGQIRTGTASKRGTRDHNCDSKVVATARGRTAAALIDGVGNTLHGSQESRLGPLSRGDLAGLALW